MYLSLEIDMPNNEIYEVMQHIFNAVTSIILCLILIVYLKF